MIEPFVLEECPRGWRLIHQKEQVETVDIAPTDEMDRLAQTIIMALKTHGYNGQGLAIALATGQCLWARISIADLPSRNRRSAMLYRFEEKIPMPAEEVAVDFIEAGDWAFGACTRVKLVAPLVESLRDAGIQVTLIAPSTLLVLQGLGASATGFADDGFLLQQGDRTEYLAFEGGCLAAWFACPSGAAGLRDLLPIGEDNSNRKVRTINTTPELINTLDQLGVSERSSSEETYEQLLARGVADVQRGAPAMITFNRGALAAAPLYHQLRSVAVAALLAGIFLIASVSATLAWRARHCDLAALAQSAEQAAEFKRLFPSVTYADADRQKEVVGQELHRLRALLQSQTSAQRGDGLTTLNAVVTALPRDTRFALANLQIAPERISLEGQVRSFGDAEKISHALGGVPGLAIDPPRTDQSQDGTISFSVSGALHQENTGTETAHASR